MNKLGWITPGYFIASCAVVALFCVVAAASHYGWGLSSDAQALAQARRAQGGSVRAGSLHSRHYYGGGPGFGK